MGHKFGYYSLKMPLEEVLNRRHSFWANNSGKINSQTKSPNSLIYTLIIAPQPGLHEPIIYCPSCGKNNNQNNAFCKEYGTKMRV